MNETKLQPDEESEVKPAAYLPHHSQQELCTTRPTYRRGKKLTAVKVYTVNKESQHLLIYYVPSIDLKKELAAVCNKFGLITLLEFVARGENDDKFSEVYHVRYEKIVQARFAKKHLDNRSFYGSLLHVCYAPELESYEETCLKLINRRSEITFRTTKTPQITSKLISRGQTRKIKKSELDAPSAETSSSEAQVAYPSVNFNAPSTSRVYPSQQTMTLPGTSQEATNDAPATLPKMRKTEEKTVNRIIFYRKITPE